MYRSLSHVQVTVTCTGHCLLYLCICSCCHMYRSLSLVSLYLLILSHVQVTVSCRTRDVIRLTTSHVHVIVSCRTRVVTSHSIRCTCPSLVERVTSLCLQLQMLRSLSLVECVTSLGSHHHMYVSLLPCRTCDVKYTCHCVSFTQHVTSLER